MWFYYISPMSYIFKALMVNEYTASDYDFDSPNPAYSRFGDFVLRSRGTVCFDMMDGIEI